MARPQFILVLDSTSEPVGYPPSPRGGAPCSFCHTPPSPGQPVLACLGREIRICSGCVALCLQILTENPKPASWAPPPPREGAPKGRDLLCSFCDTSQREVFKLVAGPGVYICDSCITEAGAFLEGR